MVTSIPHELAKFDRKLAGITRQIRVLEAVNPTRESQQREKAGFFAALDRGEAYSPIFEYNQPEHSPDEVRDLLGQLTISGSSPIEQLFQDHIAHLYREIDVVEASGTPTLTGAALELHGLPDPGFVQMAGAMIGMINLRPEIATHADEEMAEAAREHLSALGYDQLGWTVSVEAETTAGLMVSAAEQQVIVKRGEMFTDAQRITLLAHEIDGHVRRKVNGAATGYETLGQGVADYIQTEEGLCLHLEEEQGGLTPLRWMQILGRVLATEAALRSSFFDTYHELLEYGIPDELAYGITARVKRGLTDTSQSGGYIKDFIYFVGKFEVMGYLQEHPLSDLLLAPVSLDHIPLVKQIVNDG